ncbi:unnamed protein product [Penicillium glandicola]
MKQEGNNLKCVDACRYEKTLPLLKALGYDIPGRGYHIYRICEKTEIVKRPGLKNLVFPLSVGSGIDGIASGEVQVGDELLAPGYFLQLSSNLTIPTGFDCLIVHLPEK